MRRVMRRAARVLTGAIAICGATAGVASAACPAPIAGLGSGSVHYVSPSGSDANAGTSPCSPWQTMGKVESYAAKPGDTIAFEGGQAYSAPLSPWANTAGTAAEPIFYTSYGTGQADLTGGVYLNSVAYLTFDDLNITNAAGPGVGTGGAGSGASHIAVENSTVSSTYAGATGGYGIGLRNALDSNWLIVGDQVTDTADSGIFLIGHGVTITGNTLSNDGIGPFCGTGSGQNPCHAIYGKGPNVTVIGNTISNPQTAGVSLRYQNDVVQGNTISGGQKGIAFSSETTTPGTSYILGNTVYGQSDTAIEVDSGTQPVYESFVIASNTVYDPAYYGVYVMSGPNSARTQKVTLADNLISLGNTALAYIDLTSPTGYTRNTYTEHDDLFYGSGSSSPFYVNGSARSWKTYTGWFGAGSEGQSDQTNSNPLLDTSTFGLGSGSPAIGAGTTVVPGITYVARTSCPASTVARRWAYCGKAPDIGSH